MKKKNNYSNKQENIQKYEQERIHPHKLSYGYDETLNESNNNDNDKKYWSDYLSLPLHNRTCHSINNNNNNEMEENKEFKDDIYNNIRYQIEDCD